ncbi:DegV family protein [uncultured Dubosiella sp.]|uniref:DegV family protein n=1 Tax=uncultured Dubosiella sp. TaxID=1937011 RepID=UPI002608318A|nr:DegV family protein [uncultured Dubosiella sp.]
MRCAVVTDTNSGFTREDAKGYGIELIPMPVIIDDQTHYEGVDIDETQFYEWQKEGRRITTSQPAPGNVMKMWDDLLAQGYEAIIHIPMTSGLSNSCQTAMMLAEDYDGKVIVIDDHRISIPLQESVLKARKLADEGIDPETIKKTLEEDGLRSSIYISVNTLKYLKRGGRITPAVALIGSVLGIKPILTIQGEKLDTFSKARSMKKCRTIMIDALKKDYKERFSNYEWNDLCVGAAGTGLSQEEIEAWINMLQKEFPETTVRYSPLSLSIGTHTGPGAIGCAICVK